MRSRFTNQSGDEALFDGEIQHSLHRIVHRTLHLDLQMSAGFGTTSPQKGSNPGALNPVGSATTSAYNVGQGMVTGDSEALGDSASNAFNEMAFSIEKVTVTAKSRALKASTV